MRVRILVDTALSEIKSDSLKMQGVILLDINFLVIPSEKLTLKYNHNNSLSSVFNDII